MTRQELEHLKTITLLLLKSRAEEGWVPVERVGHALDEAFEQSLTLEPGLVVGWRSIAKAVGAESASALTVANSLGRLPVKPTLRGRNVCMNTDQLDQLRQYVKNKGRNRR